MASTTVKAVEVEVLMEIAAAAEAVTEEVNRSSIKSSSKKATAVAKPKVDTAAAKAEPALLSIPSSRKLLVKERELCC